jgi:hypothetical protein
MTRFHSRRVFWAPLVLGLAGCVPIAGEPAKTITEPDIAGAYLPLHGRIHLGLDRAAGAAVVIAPGIAVTNAHNANLLDPKSVIAAVKDYDLLFYRVGHGAAPATAAPVVGEGVRAYGQGVDGSLRMAHGLVRAIVSCARCDAPAYFTFAGDAGPGFSGGPVVDDSGKLVGITFGFKDAGRERLIFAYDMSRVRAELSRLKNPVPSPKIIQ